ncbi:MAG: hypothetical protein ACF8SC_04620 [Phycisphaerales bacterium JB037]
MITYLAKAQHLPFTRAYLASWGRRLRGRIVPTSYEELFERGEGPLGVWIFTDLDRLNPAEMQLAQHACERLRAAGATVLNEPARYVQRDDLLMKLGAEGINSFTAHPARTPLDRVRLPAFVRQAREHWGPICGLARTRDELARNLVEALRRGHRFDDLVIIEFCDVSRGDGLFHKYSSFRIGDRIIARHAFLVPSWVVKFQTHSNEEATRFELDFIRANPHKRWLRDMFDRAGVEYGRADFALKDGTPQLFEINTNPRIARPRHTLGPERFPGHRIAMPRIVRAFIALDESAGSLEPGTGPTVSFGFDRKLLAEANKPRDDRRSPAPWLRAASSAGRALGPLRPVVVPIARRAALRIARRR